MDIKVDNDEMNAIVAKAVVDSLTPERREKLITQAVTKMLSANPGGPYDRDKRSDLQKVFDDAVYSAATKYARETLLDNADFQVNIESLFADAAKKLFAQEHRDDLTSGIAEFIRKALTKDRY